MNKFIINDAVNMISDYIDLLKNSNTHCLLIQSRAGLGKTFAVTNLLNKKRLKFKAISGYMTAGELYKTLYKHRNDLLVLDDLAGIFSPKSVAFLKTALYDIDGKRMVSFSKSTDMKLEEIGNIPREFEYKGKLIIMANEFPEKQDDNFKAFISRTMKVKIEYSFKEIMDLSMKIIKSEIQDLEIRREIYWIINNFISSDSNFNLRELQRIMDLVMFNRYKAARMYLGVNEQIEVAI